MLTSPTNSTRIYGNLQTPGGTPVPAEKVGRVTAVLEPESSLVRKRHHDNMASMYSTYHLTEADYQGLMNVQQGCCSICHKDFGLEAKRACVDHDHYTLSVRGLLCTQCNTRLGWVEKNWPRMLQYLKETK